MNEVSIDVHNVSKSFAGVVALRDVSLKFHTGELYGIIGPAGAGKTTLFRVMLHLMRADSGDVKYLRDGKILDFDAFRQHISYMPQSQSLYADLSVSEHLDFFKQLYGISDDEYIQRRKYLVHLARLDNFLTRPAGKLSGGMYKKLGLICALLRSPLVMLLDEPTNGVDPISRREFWNLLNSARGMGILVIITTAYMDEAERCSDVVLMDGGKVIATGEPVKLLKEYNCDNFDDFFINQRGTK